MLRIFVLQFCVFVIGSNAETLQSGYKYFENLDGWLKLHRVPATWDEARLKCQFEGGSLASPVSESMVAAMTALMNAQGPLACITMFTGIHSTLTQGNHYSIEGVPMSKMPVRWGRDSPKTLLKPQCSTRFEGCIGMLSDGTVADIYCKDFFPFICYKKSNQTAYNKTSCGTMDYGYTLNHQTGSCYKFHVDGQIWHDAADTCSQEGGYLAIINSNAEAEVLKNLFAEYPKNKLASDFKDSAMLGYLQWRPGKGDWSTLYGQPLKEIGYSAWSPGQPDNAVDPAGAPGQHCGGMFRTALLDDLWCHIKLAFICEKNPVCDSGESCAVSTY